MLELCSTIGRERSQSAQSRFSNSLILRDFLGWRPIEHPFKQTTDLWVGVQNPQGAPRNQGVYETHRLGHLPDVDVM